jgi:dTDP-4-amino-4,6-dideoxygalactose transaminase
MRAHLHSEGIEAEPHYLSLDQTPFGRALEAPGGGACPNATSLAGRLLRLPIHARLSDEDVARVARSVLLGARTVAS